MGRIRVLPPALISRIAAGECVERPASVVKELVENALDAGAGRIEVHIADGGRELIHVTDDGCGMEPDDLPLAVAQHATSKLRSDADLFDIHTLGFRGEALASIGSVARLKLTSRPFGSDVGHFVVVEGGVVSGPEPCAAPLGTSVEVRDLFYAVPARRKFLKTNQTEMANISEQLARIALAQPAIAFKLTHQKRTMQEWPPVASRLERIAAVCGPELAEVLLPIRRQGDGVLVEGFVAPPAQCRGSSKWEYVFVNGRFIRDRFVGHAIKEAYRSLMDPSRYPVAFLFITIDPGLVDVNVHPTKVEVRWRDSNYIHGQVLAALRDKFLGTNLAHTLKARTADDPDSYRDRVRDAMLDFFNRTGTPGGGRPPGQGGPQGGSAAVNLECGIGNAESAARHRPPVQGEPLGGCAAAAIAAADQSPIRNPRSEVAPAVEHTRAQAGSVGSSVPTSAIAPAQSAIPPRAIQIHNAYLVIETDDGLMIVDQHALHERILYEELRRRIAEKTLESQRLLIPQIIRVPAQRLEALEDHAATLARLGIELSAAGPSSVAVQAFPSFLERLNLGEFVRGLLDLLAEPGTRPAPDTLLHEILDMMACKAAVKAGDPLTPDEIAALLSRRDAAERSSHCPHGRPTTLRLTLRDLERQFKRR